MKDFHTLASSPSIHIPAIITELLPIPVVIPRLIFFLIINVVTQYLCVRGVNRLTAISSALSIAIVLNIRKFTSLALSVVVFGNPLPMGVKVGATLVGAGAAWYAFESSGRQNKR